MPLYEYKCQTCCTVTERLLSLKNYTAFTICEKCGATAKRIFNSKIGKDWFRPHINEDFNGEPIMVESKRHYKKLCKEHGVQARCLM